MRHTRLYWVVGFSLLPHICGAAAWVWQHYQVDVSLSMPAVTAQTLDPPPSPTLVVAPGRVEPISEAVEVGVEISGKIKTVLVEEGDQVQHGQTLALLSSSDYEAQLVAAEARLRQAQAEWQRLINGARREERREAWAAVEQAEAMQRQAEAEMTRRQMLDQRGYIAREEADRARRDFEVATARLAEARERHALITAAARPEDRDRAQAAVALARAQLQEAQARLDKAVIRSPLTGTVLRKHVHPGEGVSPESPPSVLFTVADTTTLRVRVEVDEADISKVQVGQEAYVTAKAYGDTKFRGRVARIGQMLGKKKLRTEAPVEHVDTKVLEILVDVEDGRTLVPGLRVDAFIIIQPVAVSQPTDV